VRVERRIFVVRHGETEFNAARIFQTPDVPLSERGRAQAQRVATHLRGFSIDRILASDLARAVETARAIERETGAPLAFDPLLQERNFGDLRGTPYSAISGDPFAEGYAPPGGETVDDFHVRVDAAWRAIAEATRDARGDVVVVTHGLVCRAIARRVLGLDAGALARSAFANTCVTEVVAEPPWRALRVACTAHLDGGGEGAQATSNDPRSRAGIA